MKIFIGWVFHFSHIILVTLLPPLIPVLRIISVAWKLPDGFFFIIHLFLFVVRFVVLFDFLFVGGVTLVPCKVHVKWVFIIRAWHIQIVAGQDKY